MTTCFRSLPVSTRLLLRVGAVGKILHILGAMTESQARIRAPFIRPEAVRRFKWFDSKVIQPAKQHSTVAQDSIDRCPTLKSQQGPHPTTSSGHCGFISKAYYLRFPKCAAPCPTSLGIQECLAFAAQYRCGATSMSPCSYNRQDAGIQAMGDAEPYHSSLFSSPTVCKTPGLV